MPTTIRHRTEKFKELVQLDHAIRAQDALNKALFKNPDQKGNSPQAIAERLHQALVAIHAHNALDSSQFDKGHEGGLYFNVHDLPERYKNTSTQPHGSDGISGNIFHILQQFAQAAYDETGRPKLSQTEALQHMQHMYERITHEVPLNNVNFAAGVLLTELARSDNWKEIFPHGLDFSRASPGQELAQRFNEAIQPDKPRQKTLEFINHNEACLEISGHRFLPVRIDWRTHLVTEHGYLIDLETAPGGLKSRIEDHIKSGKHIGDFPEIAINEDIGQHIEGTIKPKTGRIHKSVSDRLTALKKELSELQQAPVVDGKQVFVTIPFGDESPNYVSKSALVCMDTDLLTGLYFNGQKPSELEKFKACCKAAGIASDPLGMSDLIAFLPKDSTDHVTPNMIRDSIA